MTEPRIDLAEETGVFMPGCTVDGVVSWSLDEAPRSVLVALVWHTEGKGTGDTAIVDRTTIDEPAAADSTTFALRLPSSPWSVSGKLVSVVWAVEVMVTPRRGRAAVTRRRIVVSPTGKEVDLQALTASLGKAEP